jgi:Cd2+/Zn2+-exporting ATPase
MKFKYTITGIDCPNCAAKLAAIMSGKDGVISAKINFLTEKLTVESELSEDALMALLSKTAKDFEKGIKIEK